MQIQTNNATPYVMKDMTDLDCQQTTGGANSMSRSFASVVNGETFTYTNDNGVIKTEGTPPDFGDFQNFSSPWFF